MNPLHILVCGTNYGKIYLDAVRLGGPQYHLAGILARGSARSQQMACDYGVSLYRRVEDLHPDIDLACAAVGASGFDVVLSLLARDIHVLCEHPQKPSCIKSALEVATARGLCFHVNGHFADLEASEAFINHCRRKSGTGSPSFFHVTATDRSLYAVLDILRRVLVSLAPFQFYLTSRLQPFTVVQGLLNSVPVTFQIQRCPNGHPFPDGSPSYLVDHRITVGFPSGILSLLSMNGPVVWNENLSCAAPRQQLFSLAYEDRSLTTELLRHKRIAANVATIAMMARSVREGVIPPEQTPEYLIDVSHTWATLGGLL
jgi:thiazolinyl imide reductase